MPGHRHGIFISYARADGEEAAARLREHLEQAPELGIVWQDRDQLEGGIGWWPQIQDAIDASEFLVLVMTPAAARSMVVRQEWTYARQQGVCVYPVIAGEGPDFQLLPHWMAKAHFHHLPQEWKALLDHLRRPCRAPRVRLMAPNVPTTFVKRPAEFERVRESLIDAAQNPRHGAVVVRGPGGFGKTTLAAAICHDEGIQNAFDDGILWVTLGQKPDIVMGLSALYVALTGERRAFAGEEDAAWQLAELYADSDCLIVLDDVWNLAHAGPFLRGGKRCARLITTRLNDILPNAPQITVDSMEEAQALAMLGFGREPAQLARRLGYWPLLIELTRSRLAQLVQAGLPVSAGIAELNEALEEEGIEAFDHRNPAHPNQAVRASMEVSLRLLTANERERYVELGIFPEDADISFDAIRRLWNLTEYSTKKLLSFLSDLSLVEFDRPAARVRIHDVIRKWLAGEMRAALALHTRLIASWGDPHGLEDEYAWRWFGYHMANANRREELRLLLLDIAWMEAKLAATNVTALVNDYTYLLPDTELERVQSAISLAAHVVSRDPAQLAGQLLGRLAEPHGLLHLEAPVRHAELRPLQATLSSVGGCLVRTLAGHTRPVYAVAVTADGRRAVSASSDRTLKVWDLASGIELLTLTADTRAVAIMVDGLRAITASDDQALRLWDLQLGRELATLRSHENRVDSLALSGDGRWAVSGAILEPEVIVWDLEKLCRVRKLTGNRVLAIRGPRLYVLSGNHLVVHDLEGGTALKTVDLSAHFGPFAVKIFPDGSRALTVGGDARVALWDLESGREISNWIGYRRNADMVSSMDISADGCTAVLGSFDHTLTVRDLVKQSDLARLEGHSEGIKDVAIAANGEFCVSASDDGTLKVWNIRTGREFRQREFDLPSYGVYLTAVAAGGNRALSTWADHTETYEWYQGYSVIDVWDLATGRKTGTLPGQDLEIHALAVTADCRLAVSASEDHTLKVWDLESGKERATLRGHTKGVNAVVLTNDGLRAVSASSDRTLRLWDVETGLELAVFAGQTDKVEAVAVTADGTRAISASADGTLRMWDMRTGAELRVLAEHQPAARYLIVTTDGRVMMASDNELKSWDAATGQELGSHRRPPGGLALSPDGQRMAICSEEGTLTVWDLASGRELAAFTGDGPLRHCVFAGGGKLVVAGAIGKTVHFLQLLEPSSRARAWG
ncbi:MAG TPA: TIR domain-containing protein [Terriglobia bacterium]|nr:TIR domain-containing protein [Terriglobia bacterium]